MTTHNIGLFPMCADILHAGHVAALKEAKSYCNKLIVALNCDPDGKNPIQSVFERYLPLDGCKYVDAIIPYSGRADLELCVLCWITTCAFSVLIILGKSGTANNRKKSAASRRFS